MWFSFFIGYAATWYYTGILFKWVPAADFFQSFFIYGLWVTVILTITVFFSAALLSPGIAGFVSLAVIIVLSLVTSSLSHWLEWSPAQLGTYASEILLSKGISDYLLPTSLLAGLLLVILLVLSIVIFRKKELAT
jgi:ABC-2 type transport system permease protein